MTSPASGQKQNLQALQKAKFDFGLEAAQDMEQLLKKISHIKFNTPAAWKAYYYQLLFILAYPASKAVYEKACSELNRIADYLKGNKAIAARLPHSGLPHTAVTGCFSCYLNYCLMREDESSITIHSIEGDKEQITHFLQAKLTGIEKEMLSEEILGWKAWLKLFAGKTKQEQLAFILQQTFDPANIAGMEAAFAVFRLYTKTVLQNNFSAFMSDTGKLAKLFYHEQGLDRRTIADVFNFEKKAIRPINTTIAQKQQLVKLARSAIYPLFKETDPFTYAQVSETEYFQCGRGISVALFYMLPEKKLELESYAGYLLLKNNIPLAYGGGWVLGRQCRFGLNILPYARGGESALICQTLMQVFVRQFAVKSFVIEPFQLGKNNAEGIQSAAFWFYYKLGFRPMQHSLAHLAESEFKKLKGRNNYRCSRAILARLSHSLMTLQSTTTSGADKSFYDINAISKAVTHHIKASYQNNRKQATVKMKQKFAELKKDLPLSLLLIADLLHKTDKKSLSQLKLLAAILTQKKQAERAATLALQQQKNFLQWLQEAGVL